MPRETPITRIAQLSRSVAVGLVANIWPGEDQLSLEARLVAKPRGIQAVAVGAALGGLLMAAFLAAQFGWVGLLIFFVAVILLVG